jgi:hypothetical protein
MDRRSHMPPPARARATAAIGLLAAVGGAVGAIALRIVDPVPVIPDALGFTDLALVSFEFLGVTFAAVGALLVVRRPENAVGWLMVLVGISNALAGLAAAVTFSAVADGPSAAATAGFAGWLTVLFAMTGSLVFGLGFIFPTGRGHTPAWDRFVRLGAVALLLVLVVFILLRPGPLQVFESIDNPLGIGPDLRPIFGAQISTFTAASAVLILPILALSILSRYRMSDAVGRKQLKWFTLALLIAVGGVAAAATGAWVSREPPQAGLVVFGFAGALVPVAIGIAILRHGLYDIDRLISRSLGYALITGMLAAVFAATAVGLSALLASLAQGQSLAVAAATLVVLTLFGPLRRRAQAAIDRRFDRSGYDASLTIQALTARLRDDVDIDRVAADILGVVDQTFHPANAGMWLRRGSR